MNKNSIALKFVKDTKKGMDWVKQKLYGFCDRKTALFLSGGSTPKTLYEDLAKEAKLNVGAVAMMDERFGEPYHKNSNEKMIRETGFLSFLEKNGIAFYSILKRGLSRERLAKDYDETAHFLFSHFPKSIGILGIGPDSHTAGIAPNRPDFTNPIFGEDRKSLLVSEFADPKSISDGGFGERITLTFGALEHMHLLIILCFGENKKEALDEMFTAGPIKEIPARFFLMPNIARKTVLITDQNI